ncbi:MAG: lipid-A-disaccharide synthase [Saprospirales bacterium]|jgi:lipid-A-disaccharide synthase|nr:lipid-A-disaccharide synthase [Saprospirales bacterium]
MKLYIIAGEASGDLHGSNLIRALKKQNPAVECRVWGGDLMAAAGGQLVRHYRDLAFMGFWEVLKNLRTILGNIRFCKQELQAFRPDVLVLIDYPGFNLRIARWAKRQGIRVVYYISPQIWAWHTSRVHAIKRDVDKMLVILPFEKAFYDKYDMDVDFVGHPLLDVLTPDRASATGAARPGNTIALLPGSRQQEVRRILPVMLAVTPHFPDYQFVVAGAISLSAAYYERFLAGYPQVQLHQGSTYEVLRRSCAALVKSGTSTLETALIGVPQVVCYAGNSISFAIAKRVVNVPYISLVNLILDRLLVRELIQGELSTQNLRSALANILDKSQAHAIQAGYHELRQVLGAGGASEKAASIILQMAKDSDTPHTVRR